MKPFVVFTLPCPREAWLAAFLSYADVTCVYNASLDLRHIDDLYSVLDVPRHGFVDTSLAMLWPEIVDHVPFARLVTVRQPVEQVLAYMAERGFATAESAVRRLDFALNEIESLSNVLRLGHDELEHEAGARKLFEFCLPYQFDLAWWHTGKDVPIEISASALAAKASANAEGYFNTFARASHYYDKRLAEQHP